jgi:hypothetical protein
VQGIDQVYDGDEGWCSSAGTSVFSDMAVAALANHTNILINDCLYFESMSRQLCSL